MSMNNGRAALAVFVKTPGLSPIKTRLAAGIGRDRANEFFRLSLAAIETTVAAAADKGGICPYWAVAEDPGLADPRRQRFARIYQGAGGLADRLGRVFRDLKQRCSNIIAIGADSPQITPEIIAEAFGALHEADEHGAHVLGRCHDGGFYLVGTSVDLPGKLWEEVPYSTPRAAERLAARLLEYGMIHELPRITDADEAADLPLLRGELEAIPRPSAEQLALLNWLSQFPAQP